MKNRDHLACLGLSRLADLRYSRSRWSVRTTKGSLAPSNQWRHSSKAAFMARSSRSPTSNSAPQSWVSENRRQSGRVWEDYPDAERVWLRCLCWKHPPSQRTLIQGQDGEEWAQRWNVPLAVGMPWWPMVTKVDVVCFLLAWRWEVLQRFWSHEWNVYRN